MTTFDVDGGMGNQTNETELKLQIADAVRDSLPPEERNASDVAVELNYAADGATVAGATVEVGRADMSDADAANVRETLNENNSTQLRSALAANLALEQQSISLDASVVLTPPMPAPLRPPPPPPTPLPPGRNEVSGIGRLATAVAAVGSAP